MATAKVCPALPKGGSGEPAMMRSCALSGVCSGPARALAGYRMSRPRKDDDMTTARELMTPGAECAGENETLVEAARKMRDLDVGALPICGEDDRLKGMLTDRDIVVKCLAEGGDPNSTKAGDLAQGEPVTIGADDP